MHRLFNVLLITLLAGCIGNKTQPNLAIYDFGLAVAPANGQLPEVPFLVEDVSAPESLNNNRIRYRLNYENAARLYNYTESRWLAPPAELLTHRLRGLTRTAPTFQSCTLKMQLATFDHVFDRTDTSNGMVILLVELIDTKMRNLVMSQRIEQSIAAPSQDAKGGVAALKIAGDNALMNALAWGKSAAATATTCR